jgi:hypothetical protein
MNRHDSGWDVLALLIVAGSRILTQSPAPATRGTSHADEIKMIAKEYDFNLNPITIEQGQQREADRHLS